ncbi:hypothetical protein ACFWHQ_15100 [Streptomyces sp. NPDC060334]|uniref:hypothetical protein n=1 Tax=Streptomyces sp. NPDC060334 TaxID=3347099 RepID=UPI003648494A
MTSLSASSATRHHGAARRITNGLDPKFTILAVCLIMGTAQSNHWTGLGWAVHVIVFAALIPTLYIRYGVNTGKWDDRYVGQRERRVRLIPVIMASVAAGITLMIIMDAPQEMLALIVAMLVTLAAILPITKFWKISVHTAVASGALAMLIIGLSPWWALGYILLPVIAWSRVTLRDHTWGQVTAGTGLGAMVAGATFALLA